MAGLCSFGGIPSGPYHPWVQFNVTSQDKGILAALLQALYKLTDC